MIGFVLKAKSCVLQGSFESFDDRPMLEAREYEGHTVTPNHWPGAYRDCHQRPYLLRRGSTNEVAGIGRWPSCS
jgi:hypothetical protein